MTQNVTTDYNRTPNNEPKKSFQWRLVTTRILPIFLGVLLVAGVSIAAVPSWRAAFNKFIAKFSPQASEVGCQTTLVPSYILDFYKNKNPKWMPFLVNGSSNPENAIVDLKSTLKLTLDNQRPGAGEPCSVYRDNCFFKTSITGVSTIKLYYLPEFNVDGWPVEGNKVLVPTKETPLTGVSDDYKKVVPGVQKLIENVEPNFDAWFFYYNDTEPNRIANAATRLNWYNTIPEVSYVDWPFQKFNGIYWYPWHPDYQDKLHVGCTWEQGSSGAYILTRGNYSVTIHPYKATNEWKSVAYEVAHKPGPPDSIAGDPANPCGTSLTSKGYGFYYIQDQLRIMLALDAEPKKSYMEEETNTEGKKIQVGKAKIFFTTLDKDSKNISAKISMTSPSDKVKFIVNGQETDKIDAETDANGHYTLDVKSYEAGKFTFKGTATAKTSCDSNSSSAEIEFVSSEDLSLTINKENPDNTSEVWQEKDGYLQVPVSDPATAKPRVKLDLKYTDKIGNCTDDQKHKLIKIIADFDKPITLMDTNADFTVETDDNCKATFYARSDKSTNKDETPPKGKFKAEYTPPEGDKVETVGKNKDGNEMGVEFVKPETKISVESICISPNKEQKKQWEELAVDIGMAKVNKDYKSWIVKLIDNAKDKIFSLLKFNNKAFSQDNTGQVCNANINKVDGKNIVYVANITKLDLKTVIKGPKSILSQYGKIFIKFTHPVGTKLNEKALNQAAQKINGDGASYVTYGNWGRDGRIIIIDITNKIKKDADKPETLIESLLIEYEINDDISDDFGLKYELVGEKNETVQNYFVESAKAAKEDILAASEEKKFKINKPQNSPHVYIDRIEREINGQVLTLANPLEYDDKGEAKLKAGVPEPASTNPDLHPNFSEYIKANNMLDLYKDSDGKWQVKVFPGDKIYYQAKYVPGVDLDYIDFMMAISWQAEDWMCKTGCGEKYHMDEKSHILSKKFDKIPAQGMTEEYWVKLKNEIPLTTKQIGTFIGIGDWDLNYIFIPPDVVSFKNYKEIWQKNDLFGYIKGQIKAADGDPLPQVLVGLIVKDEILPSFNSYYKKDKKILRNFMTDMEGKFSIEFCRQTDFLGSDQYPLYKLAVHYYDLINSPNRAIKTSELKNSDVLYFFSREKQFPQSATTSGDTDVIIDLSQGDRDISYPSDEKNWIAYQESIGGSIIWKNIILAFKIAKNDYKIDVDKYNDFFSINLLPPSGNPEKDLSFAKKDSIYLAHNVWDSAYFTPKGRSAHNELHEFAHYLLIKEEIDSTKQDTDGKFQEDEIILDVPMIDQAESGQCGPVSTWAVARYVNAKLNKENPPTDVKVGFDCPVSSEKLSWLQNNSNSNWRSIDLPINGNGASSDDWQKVRKSIFYGYPVIAYTDFYRESNGIGHVFVLTGYYFKDGEYYYYANNVNPNNPFDQKFYDERVNTTEIAGVELSESNINKKLIYYNQPSPGFIYMPESYAAKHPIRENFFLNSQYYGYLNAKTNYSFIEGLSAFLAVDLDNKIHQTNNWLYRLPRREVEYNLNVAKPSFAGYGSKYPEGVTNQTNESWVIASLLKQIVYGGVNTNEAKNWFPQIQEVDLQEGLFNKDLGGLINILKNDKPKNVYEFMQKLIAHDIGTGNVKIFNQGEKNELVISDIKKDFLLFGFFKDQNGNWEFDTTGLENIGQAANIADFKARYFNINNETKRETIFDTSIKSSPYIETVTGSKSTEKNPYIVDIERIVFGEERQTKNYSSRPYRREIPPIYSSYIKLNFPGKESNKVTIKVEFDEPNQTQNYSYDYEIKSGQLTYLTFPVSTYHCKVIVSAEGYSDTIIIDSNDYWNAINSDLFYNYMLENTFGQETPSISDNPDIKPSDPTGNPIDKVAGGENIVINAKNFIDAKKVTAYIGKKKIGEANTLGPDFGLEVKVPDSAPLGSNIVKLVDDKGNEATAKINVTSNKWFNSKFLMIIFSIILIVAVFILVYYFYNNRRGYLDAMPQ